jgi:repressor LexA
MNLTPRQIDVLVAIRNYRHLRGRSPTFQELADQLGLSKPSITEHIVTLAGRGLLKHNKYKHRSLELLDDVRLPDEDRSTRLPVLGSLVPGSPIKPPANREELDLEALFHSNRNSYVLRVLGESMIDDQLCDGDYVVVEQRDKIRNGDTVVAILDDQECTLKRYFREAGGKVRLQPANKTHKPQVVPANRVKVQGVIVGVLRLAKRDGSTVGTN